MRGVCRRTYSVRPRMVARGNKGTVCSNLLGYRDWIAGFTGRRTDNKGFVTFLTVVTLRAKIERVSVSFVTSAPPPDHGRPLDFGTPAEARQPVSFSSPVSIQCSPTQSEAVTKTSASPTTRTTRTTTRTAKVMVDTKDSRDTGREELLARPCGHAGIQFTKTACWPEGVRDV